MELTEEELQRFWKLVRRAIAENEYRIAALQEKWEDQVYLHANVDYLRCIAERDLLAGMAAKYEKAVTDLRERNRITMN